MERFYRYWKKHIEPEPAAWDYLRSHARVKSYQMGTHFVVAKDARPYWCFVLSGLIAAVELLPHNREVYTWVAETNGYFTGTGHLFTNRAPDFNIRFLRSSQLLLVPLGIMRQAQQRYLSVSELLHVLKQQRIKRQETMLLLSLMNTELRYALFRKLMPSLHAQLDDREQITFLHMSRSQFYQAKSLWNSKQSKHR
jgi:hypothetical protein